MKHIYRSLMVLGALMLLSSCLVPEKFTCDILIKADGSYSLTYKGTMANYMALVAIEQNGKILPEEKNICKEQTVEYANIYGLKNYSYIGDGRIQAEHTVSKNDGTPLRFPDVKDLQPWFIVSKNIQNNIVLQSTISKNDNGSDFTLPAAHKIDGLVTITSELPVLDAGGLEVQKKGGGLFGGKTTYVIRQVIKSVPEKSIVLTFGTK